ncbi:hypothetical protein IP88_09595 [alpha proteobacterium AAP81b]|nr:hypothetical protein IP88_09595 [alpha proteobacterium AAP81b]
MHAIVDPETLARPRRRWLRPALLLSVPLLLVAVGAWLWLASGGSVSTDDAYVQQDRVAISSDVTGRVQAVIPRESQPVKRGDVLIRLWPRPFEIALARADADLAAARLQATGLSAGTTGAVADVAGKRDAVAFARAELERQQRLMTDGFTTRARLQAAEYALQKAQSEYASALADVDRARAAANASGRGTHPLVLAAMAARDKAAFDLARTIVRAPADGIATQTDKVLPGQIMIAGVPTMALAMTGRRWIEANFKETDLEHMRPGQRATIRLDAWPRSPLIGRVESIGAATGSELSVLPPQNATGNWVKVVQRVPVRIALPADATVPLIAGLSATVTVETGK